MLLSQSGTTAPLTQEQIQLASTVPVKMAPPRLAAAVDRINPESFIIPNLEAAMIFCSFNL
jgi:hypothetical protein